MDNANLINKINEYKLNNNMNESINKIKDRQINQLKEELNQNDLIKKYEQYLEKTIIIFNNILNKINLIHDLLKYNKNDNLINLMKIKFNFNNLDLDNISKVIDEELERFKNYVLVNNKIQQIQRKNRLEKIKKIVEKRNKKKYVYKLNNKKNDINKVLINNKINKNKINLIYYVQSKAIYNIFGNEFVDNNKDNIELIINGKKNKLVSVYELSPGENIITLVIKNPLMNLNKMFYWCNSLKSINELIHLDVSQARYFEQIFYGTSISDILPLKSWNVSKGESFAGIFYKCTSLSDITPLKNWNLSKCKNLGSMFFGCSLLSDITPLKLWNVSNCTNFDYMFSGCSLLSNISPLKDWIVSNGINFSYMLDGCSLLTNLKPLSEWDVSKCINFEGMFYRCSSLADVAPLRNWNVLNCYNFSYMFSICSSLLDLKPLDNWNVPKEKLKYIKQKFIIFDGYLTINVY